MTIMVESRVVDGIPRAVFTDILPAKFPIEKSSIRVAEYVTLLPHERALLRKLGSAQNNATPIDVRNTNSGWHKGNVLDPHTGEVIDCEHDRSYPHVHGLAAQFMVSVVTGVETLADASGKGDKADQGDVIEDKANSWTHKHSHEMKVPVSKYDAKPWIEWYNAIQLDKAYHKGCFVGCISRAEFHKHKILASHGNNPNWIVRPDVMLNAIAVQRGNKVVLHPIEIDKSVTSVDTGYGVELIRT